MMKIPYLYILHAQIFYIVTGQSIRNLHKHICTKPYIITESKLSV